MTILGWILCIIFSIGIIFGGIMLSIGADSILGRILSIVIAIILCVAVFLGARWYFTSTASGIRELTDERSNLSNGLERIINVYTADGNLIAHYEGKIDLEMDQDYVKFDWEGRRYIYYNCFIETIAVIP